ncbi:MAG: hypothetical protein HXX16_19020 [Bacteroidales bacterium]|nr:hypothetical protein [Bacteroidales bacterium]
MKFKTLEYFASNLTDPMWEVFEVLNDKNHPQYDNLMSDIENIDNFDLDNFVKEHHIDHFLNRQENKELGRRTYYLVFKLQKEITKERIIKLLEFDKRPEPYTSENLSDIILDKNGLIATNQLDLKYCRFQYGEFVYELSPINGSSNSSYWIFQAILECINNSKTIFKVRLDPFKEIRADDYNPVMYKMHVHGKPLDWDKLRVLKNEDFGQWFNEQNNSFTDYAWTPKDEEIHFTCEEFPSFSYNGFNTSRYFHAIFNKKSGNIKHCDGAIRVYDDFEIVNRGGFHVRQAEVRKVGKRIKIFQFDTKENQYQEISQDDFCQLAVNFFVWNYDVQNYFN